MSFLFGGGQTNAVATPKYTGIQLQTSAFGVAVPIIYGATRVGWNLGDYQDFKSVTTPTNSGGKGVLGGGGKGGGGSTVTYSASVIGLLGEGPIHAVASMWISQTQKAGHTGFDLMTGTLAQSAWSYFSSKHPSHALSYSGYAYMGAANYDLGPSANLPNINWEVLGILWNTAPGTYGGNGCVTGGDADPSLVVPDVLSNAQYGAGVPAAQVGQVNSNNETWSVPASGPFTVTVTNSATFSRNLNVVYAAGGLLTCVASSPAVGQYSFSAGVYTFNSADHGASVKIRYVSIGALAYYQSWCLASGLWISPAYVTQTSCASMIDDIALATFSDVISTSGCISLVPRGSQTFTANGHTYTAPGAPLFNLTEDDFMPQGSSSGSSVSDPVVVRRTRQSDQNNVVRIEAFDRANQYATTIVEASAQALVQKFGRRPTSSKSLHLFCDVNAALTSAHLQLQDEFILNGYDFALDERYILLDPTDVVTLTDTKYPNMTQVPVKIRELTEDSNGIISVVSEHYPGTVGSVPTLTLNTGSGTIQNFDVDPGNTLAAVFDVPVQIVNVLGLESWAAVSSASANPNWGGCDVYVSTDLGASYFKQDTIVGQSRLGVLTATLPSGSDPDTTDTVSVDLTNSLGALLSGTQSDADNGTTLCYVDGEYLSYETATLTSTYNYNLGTYLRRGMWGSTVSSHAIGSFFARLDNQVVKIPYNATDVGRTLYLKFVSFNIYGGGHQDITTLTPVVHTIAGPPVPPQVQNFSAAQNGDAIALSWTDLNMVGIVGYDILYGPTTGTVATANLLTEATRQTAETTVGIPPGTWNIYIRGRNIAGQVGPASQVTVNAINSNTTIKQVNYGPDWLGTKTRFLVHHTGVLVPDCQKLASFFTNAQLFEKAAGGVFDYQAVNPIYQPATIDLGFSSSVRVFYNPSLIDADLSGGVPVSTNFLDAYQVTDPLTYLPWSVGYVTARYINSQLQLDTTITDGIVTQWSLTIDAALVDQTENNFAVGSSGTTLVFASQVPPIGPFHVAPNVIGTPADTNGTSVGVSGITPTQCFVQYFNGVAGVAGNVNLRFAGN